MDRNEPSFALPLLAIGVVTIGIMAAGFFVVRAVRTARPAPVSMTMPPTMPTIPIPIPTGTPPTEINVVKGRTGEERVGVLSTSAPVANAEAAIAKLRPGLRSCYNRGLLNDPSMSGNIVLAIKIAPNGDVGDVSKVSGSGLSPEVEQCIIKRARALTFDAPGDRGATVQVPVTFAK